MACRTCDLIRGVLMSDRAGEIPQNVALQYGTEMVLDPVIGKAEEIAISTAKKAKRKTSKYAKAYAKHFKKARKKYTTKSGKWMKNGFKLAVKNAHKSARKEIPNRRAN